MLVLICKGYCGSVKLLMLLVRCDGMVMHGWRVELVMVVEIGSNWWWGWWSNWSGWCWRSAWWSVWIDKLLVLIKIWCRPLCWEATWTEGPLRNRKLRVFAIKCNVQWQTRKASGGGCEKIIEEKEKKIKINKKKQKRNGLQRRWF